MHDDTPLPLPRMWSAWADGSLTLGEMTATEARAFADFAASHATALEQRERLNAAVGKAPDALVGADGVARAA